MSVIHKYNKLLYFITLHARALFIEYLSLLSSKLRKIHFYSDNGMLKFIDLNN